MYVEYALTVQRIDVSSEHALLASGEKAAKAWRNGGIVIFALQLVEEF